MFPPVDQQLEIILSGTEKVVTVDELTRKLDQSRTRNQPLRVKLGCDPTAPDLHLGHSVVLRKLRQFQDLGHKALLIIGDYTALIGDPTGQNKSRPMLSDADIERNAKTYFEQAGKILDTSSDKLEVRRDLQRDAGQEPQVVMILPILEGTDGHEKMSKSKGNYIGLADSAKDMFGKTMSISDELMARWYALLLGRKPEGHPMPAKKELARALVEQYHGRDAADHALADFEKQFSKKDYSEVAETLTVPGEVWI